MWSRQPCAGCQSDVGDVHNRDVADFFWGADSDGIVDRFAEQCLSDRRLIADMCVVECVEGSDDLIGHFGVLFFVIERDGCAEKDFVAAREFGIDDLHFGEILVQKAHASVDFAQAPLAINVFGVFTAVALGRGFGDFVDHLGALDRLEVIEFVFQSLKTTRCNVHDHI